MLSLISTGGWQVAEYAQKTMIPLITKKLDKVVNIDKDSMMKEVTWGRKAKSTFSISYMTYPFYAD